MLNYGAILWELPEIILPYKWNRYSILAWSQADCRFDKPRTYRFYISQLVCNIFPTNRWKNYREAISCIMCPADVIQSPLYLLNMKLVAFFLCRNSTYELHIGTSCHIWCLCGNLYTKIKEKIPMQNLAFHTEPQFLQTLSLLSQQNNLFLYSLLLDHRYVISIIITSFDNSLIMVSKATPTVSILMH